MNSRALILGIGLTLTGGAIVKSERTPYVVKVAHVDRANGHVEGKFIVLPEDLRIVCSGDVSKIYDGDFVPVDFNNGEFSIKGAKCTEVRWYK